MEEPDELMLVTRTSAFEPGSWEHFDLEPVDDPSRRIVIEVFRTRAAAESAPRIEVHNATLESEELHYWFGGVRWYKLELTEAQERVCRLLSQALANRLRPIVPAHEAPLLKRMLLVGLESWFSKEAEPEPTTDDVLIATSTLLHNLREQIADDTPGWPFPEESEGAWQEVELVNRALNIRFTSPEHAPLDLVPIELGELGL